MKTITFIFSTLLLLACQSENAGHAGHQEEPAQKNSKEASTVEEPTVEYAKQAKQQGFTTDYLMGHFDPATHDDFTLVAAQYADREGLYLRKDTYEAFLKMYKAAQADGIKMVIRSATRNFNYQKGIWEAKWNGQRTLSNGKNAAKAYPNPETRALKILEYSSMPGTSRHHWGTDLDLNAFNNAYFEKGAGLKLYNWMLEHAATYGFCQPYTPKGAERPYGYNEEKWHWSYLPVSRPLTALAKEALKDEMIKGFDGAEAATGIGVVKKYVLGINNDCLP
jgi:LAS superfamily LD-carboxypeptidase LdcB